MAFKGGTSLSKVFGVIGRFSEDIHLSVSPAFLGINEELLEQADSRNKRTEPIRVKAEYSVKHYHDGYKAAEMNKGAYREMDFVQKQLGVEVQFGKYAFMVYNVCAKMTIFHKLGHISAGVEIVPMRFRIFQRKS